MSQQTPSRIDGRPGNTPRPVTITTGAVPYAEGSALIAVGETRVLCAASVDERVPRWMVGKGKGWVTAEYSMLPRATKERNDREAAKGRQQGRTVEIQRLIGRALRSVVDMEALGERQVIIDCDVLQADGGTRCAAITGGYVALALACAKLQEQRLIKRKPLRHAVAAISVGVVGGTTLLDLDASEDQRADVDFNVVMTDAGAFVELQGTAEQEPFSPATLEELLSLANAGLERLFTAQRDALTDTTS